MLRTFKELLCVAFMAFLSVSTSVFAQAAPPISSFQVYAVRSQQSNGNWDYLSPSAVVTNWDHGGSYIEVAIDCSGYPAGHGATMATYNMTYQRSQNKLDARGRIIGYYLIYRITNRMSDGNVSVWGTSINTGRRFTDSIRIK